MPAERSGGSRSSSGMSMEWIPFPYRRLRQRVRLTRFLPLLLLALFFCLVAAPAQAQSTGLRVTQLKFPKLIRLQWDAPAPLSSAPSSAPGPDDPTTVVRGYTYENLNREPGRVGFPVPINSSITQYDDTDFGYDVRYNYYITGTKYYWTWNSTTGTWEGSSEPWTFDSIHVSVRKIVAAENQSVDSRYDLRHGNPTLLDFNFKDYTYRGGLFAGYAADNSRVGRSYLKFTNLQGPLQSGELLWSVGGIYAYLTRLATTGSMTIRASSAASDAWSASTLVWSNAPAPGSGGGTATVSWDSAAPVSQWIGLNVVPDIERELAGDGTLSLVVQSTNETANAWAYLAKKEFKENGVAGFGAFLLYAFGGQGADPGATLSSVSLEPNPVAWWDWCTGTVTLSAAAPAGGAEVTLTSSNSAVASVPSSVIVPEGQTSATFDVFMSEVTGNTGVTITASYNGTTRTSTLTVTP